MKSIFDKTLREELINRIGTLDDKNSAQWGKMNVYQMVKHCTIWEEWVLGKNNPLYKQAFLGFVFGKMALKSMITDDRLLKKNMPAGRGFIVKEKAGSLETQKKIWIDLLAGYANFSNPGFIHDFFGKMTKEQIGILAYKHTDHHLRQFGA